MANRNLTEAQEQIKLIQYCEIKGFPYNLIFHIPNGGSRNVLEAVNLKKQGVKAGVPDLFLPYASKGYHGLFIEMKSTRKGAKTSEAQKEWIAKLLSEGYQCSVCHGFDEAKNEIDNYLANFLINVRGVFEW